MYEKAKTLEKEKVEVERVGKQKGHWVLGHSNMFDSFVEHVYQRK